MIKCNLAVLMAERGLNIQDVANQTGLSRTTISALVNENGKGIQFDTMNELCELLKVSPGQLFSYISLHHEIKLHSIDDVSIDEEWSGFPIDEKNDLEYHEHHIDFTASLSIKIRQESLIFDAKTQFKVDLDITDGKLTSLTYSYKDPNGIDEYFKKIQFFSKEHIVEVIEDVLIEETVNHFSEITSIGSLSVNSLI